MMAKSLERTGQPAMTLGFSIRALDHLCTLYAGEFYYCLAIGTEVPRAFEVAKRQFRGQDGGLHSAGIHLFPLHVGSEFTEETCEKIHKDYAAATESMGSTSLPVMTRQHAADPGACALRIMDCADRKPWLAPAPLYLTKHGFTTLEHIRESTATGM